MDLAYTAVLVLEGAFLAGLLDVTDPDGNGDGFAELFDLNGAVRDPTRRGRTLGLILKYAKEAAIRRPVNDGILCPNLRVRAV